MIQSAKNIFFVFVALVFSGLTCNAQYKAQAHQIIDTLCSPSMEGRGYVNNGDKKAAAYIAESFEKQHLQKFGKNYFQSFGLAVNTFPGEMQVSIDGTTLTAGKDFQVAFYSTSVKGTFPITYLTKSTFLNKIKFNKFLQQKLSGNFICVNINEFNEKEKLELNRDVFLHPDLAKGIILINDKKLTWGSMEFYTTTPILEISKSAFVANSQNISINIENNFIDRYVTQNVIGYIQGKVKPDSFLVFTAHYDHLGRMGTNTYFPGANDNAAGTAMLLQLAEYYSKPENKPNYSIAFMAFSAEEMGLHGSKFYVENPLFGLEKIKFLINLDLVGTGDDGIMIVNAKHCKNQTNKLKELNTKNNFVKEIKERENAANSDHYPFTQKNINAIFIYGLGGLQAYHDIYDKAETLPLTDYDDILKLLIEYSKTY